MNASARQSIAPSLLARLAIRLQHLGSDRWRGLLLGGLAALIWGAYLAMARAGVNAGLGSSDIAFLRYGVAGLIMLPWLFRQDLQSCAGVGWGRAMILALLAGPLFVMIGVGGYWFAPLAHGAVMQPAALTLASLLLASIVLRDRLPTARLMGVAIMVAGLMLIAGPELFGGNTDALFGDAMFIAAGAMWAGFTLLTKLWKLAPLQATAAVSVLSALVFVPAHLLLVGVDGLRELTPQMLLAQVLVQGVLSGVIAVIAFTRAVALLGASSASIFPAMVPAVAVLLGIPLTGEFPDLPQAIGLLVVSLGLLVALGLIHPTLTQPPSKPNPGDLHD